MIMASKLREYYNLNAGESPMIRNEAEYQEVTRRMAEETLRFDEYRLRLKQSDLSDVEIRRVIDPLESFHLQLKEEVEAYERLKRGRAGSW
jgi:hypothetical protein